jgi:hypothetical protein
MMMVLCRNFPQVALAAFCGLVTLFLSACTTAEPPLDPNVPLDVAYSETEFRRYERPGDATITGQAFLHDQGDTIACTGQPVLLFPHTRSFERVVELARMDAHPMLPETTDPRFNAVTRRTTCDTDGNFTFKGLPRGKWYVFTRVRWSAGDAGMQGGDLIGEADTSVGSARVLLGDQNRV